jgi:hypothetical protein
MNGLRLAQLLSDQDEELDILGQPRKKRRGFGYIGESPKYNSLEAYYRSKTPQEIFSQYTPSAPPPLNLQTPEPKPLDEFASVESEYTPYRPDKPIGPPTGAPTAPPLDPRDYRQAVIKDEPARPLFSGMLPSQFPEAYQIGYTPPTATPMPTPPAAVAPAAPETPVAVNPDAERLAAALQAQQQQQAQMMAAQAEMARQAEIQRQIELARIEEERRRAAAESAGVDDGGGR